MAVPADRKLLINTFHTYQVGLLSSFHTTLATGEREQKRKRSIKEDILENVKLPPHIHVNREVQKKSPYRIFRS